MKNIYTKFSFHNTYYFLALGFILTGMFKNLLILTSIITIHELGHCLMSLILKVKIKKIIMYPFGGITKIDSLVNISIKKEFLIAISGIILQTIYYYMIVFFFNQGFIKPNTLSIFNTYHQAILIFNLLPIIPLDGSKIITIILYKCFSFKTSNKIITYISLTLIIIIILFYYHPKYKDLLILSVLLTNIYNYYKNIDYLYQRFLLERYLYKIKFPHIKIITNNQLLYKEKTHYIKNKQKIVKEEDYLNKLFDFKM